MIACKMQKFGKQIRQDKCRDKALCMDTFAGCTSKSQDMVKICWAFPRIHIYEVNRTYGLFARAAKERARTLEH